MLSVGCGVGADVESIGDSSFLPGEVVDLYNLVDAGQIRDDAYIIQGAVAEAYRVHRATLRYP